MPSFGCPEMYVWSPFLGPAKWISISKASTARPRLESSLYTSREKKTLWRERGIAGANATSP